MRSRLIGAAGAGRPYAPAAPGRRARAAPQLHRLTALSWVLVLLITSLLGLASSPRAGADAPPASPPRDAAHLSEIDAIQIAEEEARRLNIDLEHFDPPSATYIWDGHRGKWHVFFVAKSEQLDVCFSVDIYRSGKRPRLLKCS